MIVDDTNIPVLSLSVHSAERISNNTDKTMFSIVSEDSTTPVVMNNTSCELYLRINMTSASCTNEYLYHLCTASYAGFSSNWRERS